MNKTMEYLDTCNADELREAIEGYKYILSKPSLRGTHEMVQMALDYATTLLQDK
jgi:hypothetical protein